MRRFGARFRFYVRAAGFRPPRLEDNVATPGQFLIVIACGLVTGCAGQGPATPNAPARVNPPAPPAPAAIVVSSFEVHPRRAAPYELDGVFTLTETSGLGAATLRSVAFAAGSVIDMQDAGCWGDAPIRIAPNGTFSSVTLGYCAPFLRVVTVPSLADLAISYQNNDGSRGEARASAIIPQ
jgi:hypothetical protein